MESHATEKENKKSNIESDAAEQRYYDHYYGGNYGPYWENKESGVESEAAEDRYYGNYNGGYNRPYYGHHYGPYWENKESNLESDVVETENKKSNLNKDIDMKTGADQISAVGESELMENGKNKDFVKAENQGNGQLIGLILSNMQNSA